jgi:hypothetical protein
MAKNEKADLRGIGSNEKRLTANQRGFFIPDYKGISTAKQCRFCGSDYMRFAVDGYCQRCQQHTEYIIREHPHTAARARAGGMR